ncbi:hypothetical protein [Halohasta salina]|uniref:hypothetical protein n=1 Tax=Halohasta salina TaxID=2961621 RepID=UPI0020A2D088|nr:hypothetical protein [Halohasta salina]
MYANRNRVPVGQRARRNKLQKIEAYDLIEITGANRHREYQVVDETVSSAEDFEFQDLPIA